MDPEFGAFWVGLEAGCRVGLPHFVGSERLLGLGIKLRSVRRTLTRGMKTSVLE